MTEGGRELLYKRLVELKERVGADRATLFLVDQEAREVRSLVGLGLEITEIRLPMTRGLVGYVARTGNTVNLRDAYNDPRFDRSVDRDTGYRTRTILTMAVRDPGGRVAAVLQVLNKAAPFDSTDEDLVRAAGVELAGLVLQP